MGSADDLKTGGRFFVSMFSINVEVCMCCESVEPHAIFALSLCCQFSDWNSCWAEGRDSVAEHVAYCGLMQKKTEVESNWDRLAVHLTR